MTRYAGLVYTRHHSAVAKKNWKKTTTTEKIRKTVKKSIRRVGYQQSMIERISRTDACLAWSETVEWWMMMVTIWAGICGLSEKATDWVSKTLTHRVIHAPFFWFLANVNLFTFAICHRPSVCVSVCRLSVCNVRAPILRRLKFSAMFLCHLVPSPSVDI